MKKIMLAAMAAVALPLFAAQEKLLAVKIADNAEIIKAVGRFGEFSGNAMLGAMVSGMIQTAPHTVFFGPMRNGAPASILFYGDADAADLDKITDGAKKAIVYPVQDSKEAFLKRHPKSVSGKDGVVKVTKGEGMDMFENGVCHVVFSKDGKWAVAADDAKTAKAALSDEKFYSKGNDGDLARIYLMPAALKLLSKFGDKAVAEISAETEDKVEMENVKELIGILKSVKAGYVAIAVNDKGIDMSASVLPAEGSVLAAIGKKGTIDPLKALAAAPADSVSTYVFAPGLFDAGEYAKIIDLLKSAFAKKGVKLDFFKYSRKANDIAFAFDIKKAVEYISGEGKKDIEKIDDKVFAKEMEMLSAEASKLWYKFDRDTKAGMATVVMPPCKPNKSPSAMFAGVFSKDEIRKDVLWAYAYSFYDAVKTVLDECMKVVKDPDFDQLKPIISTLPSKVDGGTCAMTWVENGKIRALYRVSPGEVKGISSLVNVVMAGMMSQMAVSSQMSFDDEDDDDDDD